MLPDRTSFRTTFARALRQALPWVLALAVATCTDDQNGPTRGGTGYFAFRPVYGISGSLSQFGIVADSVHIRLTRPVNQLVLDTTVYFPADSSQLRLALPVALETSPETLTAVIGISSGATLLFSDSLDVSVLDGPPSVANIPTVLLTYVGPGKNVAAVTLVPGDTTIVLKDTLFFGATAVDSSAAPVASFFVGWKTSDTTVAKINGAGRLIAPNLRGSVKVIATTPTGIADSTTVIFAPVPVILIADSGTAQTGFAGDSLAALFVGQVKGSDSLGIAGIGVHFTAVTAGGAIRDTVTLVTDVNGRVRTRGVLGTVAGPYTYSATVVGTALTRTFGATATAAAPSAIALQSGDLQSDSAGRALAAPFVARVTDAFGNVVSGAKVYWTRAAGHGTVSADSTVTNASGLTSITYTLGAVGSDTVAATLAGTSALVHFRATTINGAPATATKVFGDSQTSVVGQLLTDSLAVVVKSATNFPVVGAPVAWTVIRGSAVVPDTVLTDVNGRAAVAYTLGTASGTDSVRAAAGTITAVFTAAAQAAAPSAIALLSGNGQADTANRPLPQSLVVSVTDLYGNPVLNTPVTFTRIAGHGHVGADTVTSAADNHPGTPYTFGTIPGLDSIRATLLANGASVVFAETSINATPASVIQTHGAGISTIVGTAFADSLIVQILDVNDAPIALEKVIWTVTSGSGAVTLDTVLTDSLGFAVQHVTAGSTAGALVVNAKVITPISPVNFSLSTSAAAATAIAIVSGDAQADTTGRLLPLPFVVHVADAFGNAVAGAKVGWTTVSGSGTPVTDTTLTDAAGDASTTYTLGAIAGTDTIRAGLFGTSAFVKFTGTTVSAAATSIVKLLGDAQIDTVLSTLTDSLVVSLRDGGNNPVANTWLYWATAGVTLSADSTRTDLNGRAAVRATFGAVATTFPVVVRNVDTTVATVFTLTAHAGVATQITKIQGNAQTGPVSTPLPIDFGVLVQDAHGNLALPGTSITWTNLAGFTPAGLPDTTVTDSTGIAKLVAPLPGPVAGADSLIARILGGTAADTFTVTATSGAAAHLVYVSGTGQTDTVSALLAAPLIVQARDAATNPVAGAWVHFTRVAGTGIVLTDSVQTDAAGAAQTLYSMGPFVGRDSIVATITGISDTVPFYNVSTPGLPKSLTKISGDSQSVGVSSALPAPFVVRVADQFGNPIQGPSVAFDTVGTGATILGIPAVTNAAGLATTGTVTLGATAGTITFAATTSSLPGDTLFFTAVALPIGTSKQWLGTLSANWGTAGNWSPAVIPSSSDNVFIPTAAINQPVLDLARTIGGLQIESGASLALGSFNLTVQGNAQIDGSMSRTSGLTILSAAAGTAQGNLTGVRVTGNITLSGTTFIADSLQLSTGNLVVGGHTLTINGAFSDNGSANFTMNNAADSVTVTGATLYNGGLSAGNLTNGTLVLLGDFSEPSGSAVFRASGSHKTVFAGSAAQTVTFASANIGGNVLQNVVFANAAGVTLGGNIAVNGTTSVTAGVVTGAGRTAFLGGDLSDPTSLGWNVATTSVAGTPSLLPDTILGNLDLTGTLTLAKPLVVKGNLTPNASSILAFGGFGMRVDGSMTISGAAQVKMQAAGDSLDVAGAINWNGSTSGGLLTAGTLVVRGTFSEPSGSAVFQATAGHRTVFAGTSAQTVNFGSATIAGNRFGDVEFANTAGVQLTSNAAAAGSGTVTAGAVTGSLASTTIFVGGNVTDATSTSWQVPITVLAGTPASLPDSFPAGVTVTGSVTLAKNVVIKGAYGQTAGTLTLNGHHLRVDSAFSLSGSGDIAMQNGLDTLELVGTASWNGSTSAGLLTAGTLILRGNFTEPSGSAVFQASGSHLTLFEGTNAQTVSFASAGLAGNRFQDATFNNTAGVSFINPAAIAGTATVTSGAVTSTAGQVVTVNGDIVDASNVSWAPENTTLSGTPGALPDSFTRNVAVTGTVTLGHPVAFRANLAQTAGAITLNGFHLRVDSAFTLSGSAQLKMQNTADTLDIAGATSWNGSTTAGLLTAGTLILRGSFSEPSGAAVFQASGTHLTRFAGLAAQTANFASAGLGGNRFQDVAFANGAGVSFTSPIAVAGTATLASSVVTSTGGQVATLNGDLVDPTSTDWRFENTTLSGTPGALPDSFTRNVTVTGTVLLGHPIAFRANLTQSGGAITVNGFHVRVDSGLTLTGGQFLMQNAADTVDIAGAASWNGSTAAGLLTAGTLILRGNFDEPSGAAVFQASGTHLTRFAGTAAQTAHFASAGLGGNRFQEVAFANPAGVNFTNAAAVQGTATVVSGAVTSGAGVTLTANGDIVDTSNASWRPEVTSLTGTPAVLPDTFPRNVTVSGTLAIPHTMVIGANLTLTNGSLDANGFRMRVDSGVTVTGGQFKMLTAADTVDVGGAFSINGSTTTGLLTAGALILHGDFSEPSGAAVFQPTGTHTTVFKDSVTHTVTFAAPSVAGNRFNDLRLEGPTVLALGNNVVVNGAVIAPLGLPVTIGSTAGVRSIAMRGLTVNQVTFDSVRVTYSGAPIAFLQNVTFQRQDPTAVQFAIAEAGSATPEGLQNVQFLTTPTTGKYLSATDTLTNGSPLVVQMYHSFPLDGTPFEQQVGGGDGTTIDWSTFGFILQPHDAGVLGILDTVMVAVKGPDGNPDANFTGNISLALGVNLGGATLGGTTTQAAALGVVRFSDLTLSAAGLGFTLVASTPGIAPDTSNVFNITVPLPVGFTSQWLGSTSTLWSDGTNWSTGIVPDSTTNVFISGVAVNAPSISGGTPEVNRLRLATGATLTIPSGDSLIADSTVEAGTAIVGAGTLVLRGTGTITGTVSSQASVRGTYAAAGTATFASNLDIPGDLTVGPDTVLVTGFLQTTGTGRLAMSDANALVDVTGPATFNGGSTAGSLTLGTLRVSGDLSSGGSFPDAFAPSGSHRTILNGSGTQQVTFGSPDSVTGSRFGILQVSTNGLAFFNGHYDVLGDLTLTTGATLRDSMSAGLTAHGFTQVDAGATMGVNNLRLMGGLGVAVGATYTVTTTTYAPTSGPLPVNPAPYGSLVIEGPTVVTGDFVIGTDILVNGVGATPARFDLGGHTVTVNGNVNVNADGAIIEQNAADQLIVAQNFFTNGANSEGLMTAGLLQIAGDFRQAADFSSAAFRASPAHLTRFTGGAGHRSIKFDSPANDASDSTNSKFGAVDLADGVDSLSNNGLLTDRLTLGGSVEYDTAFGGNLTALDSVIVLPGAGTLHLSQLNLWNGINVAGGPTYAVGTTGFFGGSTLPALPYQSVLISGPALTMNADVSLTGSLSIGQTGEVGGTPGDLTVNGHTLHIGGGLGIGGFGLFTMAAGDSVDVGSDISFNGGNTAGHLTGGTLVGRGTFSASGHSADSTFVADKAFRTVLADTAASTIYVNARSEAGMQFGKLILLDGAPRAISTFGSRLIVQDSLILGSATGGLGSGRNGAVLAKGPVFTVTGSAISLSNFEADSTLAVNGSWSVTSTIFGGQGQLVPNLTYDDVAIHGTATLTDSLILSTANALVIGGAGVPADLDMAGHLIRAGSFLTTEFGTLTMQNPLDTLDAGVSASFAGGDETGKITDGAFLFHGNFTQANTTSDSSFVATGANETRFTDSTVAVTATLASMGAGASRFHHVTITGKGVTFTGAAWIGGNVGIAAPTTNPVTGPKATIAGVLADAGPLAHAWDLDTTVFLAKVTTLPDSVGGSVVLQNGALLADSLRVGGFLQVDGDTLALNGKTVRVHGDLKVGGTGLLVMAAKSDSLFVDSTVTITGASATSSNLSDGYLQILGSLVVNSAAGFDATNAHITYMAGNGTRVVTFGAPGNAFQAFAYSDGTELTSDVLIRSNLTGPGETPGTLYGVDSLLTIGGTVQQGVVFDHNRVLIGETNPLFDVTFGAEDPTRAQLTIRGPGSATPVDLSAIRFQTLPTKGVGALVQAQDTLADGDSLVVRMIQSTPLQPVEYDTTAGEAAIHWSKLAFTILPSIVDSSVPFAVQVSVLSPDSSSNNPGVGIDLSLANNPAGDVLGGTLTAGFSFNHADWTDLFLLKPIGGVSFFAAVNGQPTDTVTSGAITIFNPAPLGAIIWDGSAGNGLWSDTMNWSSGTTPSPTDSVFIPSGQSVTFNTVTTLGGLVLGQGASLDLQGDLTVTGRVAAGNTITSTGGTLQLTGALMPVSGTLPDTRISGTVTASGHIAVNGNLIIDGAGAELNVGGERVDVSNTLFTQNGGLLTMDGATDSVFASSTSFAGGDETGRLTDGVLVIQGSNFDQGFGDPNSFHASGNHTTIFGNGGSAIAVNITTPASSQFAHVKVENPNGVDFNESGLGYVRMTGDLTLSAGGVVTGDTLQVDGAVSSGTGSSLTLTALKLSGALGGTGTYTVGSTELVGTNQVLPDLPYPHLSIGGVGASLGANVLAGNVDVTDPTFALGGHTLRTGFLSVSDTGTITMTNALDTLTVDTVATIQGGDETGKLTAGAVVLLGDLNLGIGNYRADPTHTLRFLGGVTHHVSASFSVEVFGPGLDWSNHLGRVEVIGDSVVVTDRGGFGLGVSGDLQLTGATWDDSTAGLFVHGAVLADIGSHLTAQNLLVDNALAMATPANFQVGSTRFMGTGQTIPVLPYRQLFVQGTAALDSSLSAPYVSVVHLGHLDLAGHALTVDTTFTIADTGHLVMHSNADTLRVGGHANFFGDDATGDMTDGVVRAENLVQAPGTSGSDNGFVQTGNAQLAPLDGDIIQMNPVGPLGSRIGFLNLNGANGPVNIENAWVADSMVNTNPLGLVQTFGPASNLVVMGNVRFTAGSIALDTLAVGGTIAFDSTAGSYGVGLTKFVGAGQVIPNDVPYNNVAVYYPATLGGALDLSSKPSIFTVFNTGDLDLNGFLLSVQSFQTEGQGVLTMHADADTLRAFTATFDGASTEGHLTAGAVQAGAFYQQNTTTDSSYAPSGTQSTDIVNIGLVPEGGRPIFMASPGAASHFNRLHIYASGGLFSRPKLNTNIMVVDTFEVIGALDASSQSVEAFGPAVVDAGAFLALDSLVVHNTLVVDPTATYTVTNTVFAAGALGLTDGVPYQNVILDSSFVLTAPFHDTLGTLIIRGTNDLTPNGQSLDVGTLQVIDEGTLTMTNPADSVVVRSQANFWGGSSAGRLSAGQLLLYGNLDAETANATDAFTPSGTHLIRLSGNHAFHNVNLAGSSVVGNRLANVTVADSGTFVMNQNMTIVGTLTVQDSAILTSSSFVTADLVGPVNYQSGARVQQPSPDVTFNYQNPVTAGTGVIYDIKQSNFYTVIDLPDLSYAELGIFDGAHIVLSHDITTSGNITIGATSPGGASLDLNTHTVSTNAFTIGTGGLHGQLTMSHATDTLLVNASATFGGDDESALLLDGVIRIGGSFTQHNTISPKAFAATGTRTEFFGTGVHPVGFDTPALGASHFGALSILDGGTLQPVTGLTASVGMTVDTSSTFDGNLMTGAHTAEFFGKVNILALGQVSDPGFSSMFFHDSLIVAPTGSYSAFNTVFQGTDGIPDASYVHMYLRQGVHLTMTHPLHMTGGLNIQNDAFTGNPADTVTIRLNGQKLGAWTVGITGYGRITMDNPADTLEVGSSATFQGLDEDTALSAGVLRIGGYLQQVGTYSNRSFAPAGTLTEFMGSGFHNVVFANPGTGLSHFGPLAVVNNGTLQPSTGLEVSGPTTIGGSAHFDGQAVPNGNTVDFFGPVTVQSGGDFHSGASLAFFNFYGASPLTVQNGAAIPYDVVNTGFSNTGNDLPGLPYQNLYLTDGVHDTLTGNLSVSGVLSLSAVNPGAQDFVLNGHTVNALTFTTQDEGRLTMANPLDSLIVAGNVTFDGGSTTGRLTAGNMAVNGDFSILTAGPTFRADSQFVVTFEGGGTHHINMDIVAPVQYFGELSVLSESFQSDTLALTVAGDLQAYKLSASGGSVFTASGNTIQAEQLAVNNATFIQMPVHVSTTSDQPMAFANVTFAGFSPGDIQLFIDHPGSASQFTFDNIDFDNVTITTPGYWAALNNNGAAAPTLALTITGPDWLNGTLHQLLSTGHETLSWLPPP